MRIVILLGAVVAGLYLVITGYILLRQRDFVFVPSRNTAITPDEVDLAYEDVYLEVSAGERIHGWFFPKDTAARTVLFCHGNAGNISRRLLTIQHLLSLGVNVFIFDYRGYGLSDGEPSEEHSYSDAEAAYNWLTGVKSIPPERIVAFGRSLGGGVAVELAVRKPLCGLVIESSFTSAVDLGKKMFPFVPIDIFLVHRYESLDKIGRVNCPILVTHSREDDLIPVEMGRRLFAAAPSPKRYFEFTGNHNERSYLQDNSYNRVLAAFFSAPEQIESADLPGTIQTAN